MKQYFELGYADFERNVWNPPRGDGAFVDRVRWWYREGWRYAQTEACLRSRQALAASVKK